MLGILASSETVLLVEVTVTTTDHADAILGIIAGLNVFTEGVGHNFREPRIDPVSSGQIGRYEDEEGFFFVFRDCLVADFFGGDEGVVLIESMLLFSICTEALDERPRISLN